MASRGPRKTDGFGLSQSPSQLLRRCAQYASDLFARELAASGLTKTQYMVLACVEQYEGVSQTELVAKTSVDRSTLAEMLGRMIEKGLLYRQRTEEDARANAVRITPTGRKALRAGRGAADRVDRLLLSALNAADRPKLVKLLATIVAAAEADEGGNGNGRPPRKKK